jgi:hypothetical protein
MQANLKLLMWVAKLTYFNSLLLRINASYGEVKNEN